MTKLDKKECTKTTPVNSLILFIYDKEYRLIEDSVFFNFTTQTISSHWVYFGLFVFWPLTGAGMNDLTTLLPHNLRLYRIRKTQKPQWGTKTGNVFPNQCSVFSKSVILLYMSSVSVRRSLVLPRIPRLRSEKLSMI